MAENTEWTGNNGSPAFYAAVGSAEHFLLQGGSVSPRESQEKAGMIIATLAWQYGVAPSSDSDNRTVSISDFAVDAELVEAIGTILLGGELAVLETRDQADSVSRAVLLHLAREQHLDRPATKHQ